MSNLKPCPYCGGEAHLSADTSHSTAFFIGCETEDCFGLMMWAERKDAAIAAWNTRALDPSAIREAALREAAASVQAGDTVQNIQRRILALIDQPAPDHSAAPGNMIDNPSNPGG